LLRSLVKFVRSKFPSSTKYKILIGLLQVHSENAVREERTWTNILAEFEPGRTYTVVYIPWTLKAIPEKMLELYYKALIFLIENTTNRIKKFVIDLESMAAYAKQGYDSPDWDSAFLIKDIQFKLERMTWEFENFGMGENDPELARQMIKANEMLEMCQNFDQEGEDQKAQEAAKEGFVYIANHFKGWWT
jgi:hypothetical protein